MLFVCEFDRWMERDTTKEVHPKYLYLARSKNGEPDMQPLLGHCTDPSIPPSLVEPRKLMFHHGPIDSRLAAWPENGHGWVGVRPDDAGTAVDWGWRAQRIMDLAKQAGWRRDAAFGQAGWRRRRRK